MLLNKPYYRKKFAVTLIQCVLIAFMGCSKKSDKPEGQQKQSIIIEPLSILIKNPHHWEVQDNFNNKNLFARLKKPLPVLSKPRIDVMASKIDDDYGSFNNFVKDSTNELYQLARDKKIEIQYEDKRQVTVQGIIAYRLRHDYVLLDKKGFRPSISQVSLLFQHEGKAITISAVAQTELYLPLSDEIEDIFSQIHMLQRDESMNVVQSPLLSSSLLRYKTINPPDIITSASFHGSESSKIAPQTMSP